MMGIKVTREDKTVELDDGIPEEMIDAAPDAAQRPKDLDVDKIYAEERAAEEEAA